MKALKFNSAICTSRSESERLLALGLKKETADMTYFNDEICSSAYNEMECPYDNLVLPAWSLHRLIELSDVGIIDTTTDNIYDKVIQYIEFLIKCGDFNKEYLEE